jgi:hypothetical protein
LGADLELELRDAITLIGQFTVAIAGKAEVAPVES